MIFINYKAFDKSDKSDIHKSLRVKTEIKYFFGIIKQVFIALLSFSRSLVTRCVLK